MTTVVAAYVRYTDKAHEKLARSWPELGDVIVGETYVEAFAFACEAVVRTLIDNQIGNPVLFVHHPHAENSADPLDAFGSLGWKSV